MSRAFVCAGARVMHKAFNSGDALTDASRFVGHERTEAKARTESEQ